MVSPTDIILSENILKADYTHYLHGLYWLLCVKSPRHEAIESRKVSGYLLATSVPGIIASVFPYSYREARELDTGVLQPALLF